MSSEQHNSLQDVERLAMIAPWTTHPQSIRTIFFDAGFTLLHPTISMLTMVQQVCEQQGISPSPAAIQESMSFAERYFHGNHHVVHRTWADDDAIATFWRAYYTDILKPLVPAEVLPQCIETLEGHFDSPLGWQPFADVVPILQRLQHRYTLGIISDWGHSLGPILSEHHLSQFFDVLLVSATNRTAKPEQYLFEEALRRADALGDYTLYVGDTYVQDILGARGAGIHPVLIDRQQYHDSKDIDCPVITDLYQLVTLLDLEESL